MTNNKHNPVVIRESTRKILDADGNPARDVNVVIKGPSGEIRVKTNDEGTYEALDLPEGMYEITVEDAAYEDLKEEVEIKKGTGT